MERQFKIIRWDGFRWDAVLTHWPQENTVAGTVWRFVMDRGQTLIAVPYQTPDKPAAAHYRVPARIEPILAAGRFGFAVWYAAEADAEDADLLTDVIEELRQTLEKYGAKKCGKVLLRELFDFIRRDVCGGSISSPAIGAASFARIVEKIEELTGTNITESLLMECEPWRLAHESGAKGLDRVHWVAVFPDRRQVLIELLFTEPHNLREAEWYEKTKPSDEERRIIERVIVQEKQADEKKRISEIRADAARKNKKTTEQEERDISEKYWNFRNPKDTGKKRKSKKKAGELTADWIARAKVNGGYGRPDLQYSSRHIQRIAGDAK